MKKRFFIAVLLLFLCCIAALAQPKDVMVDLMAKLCCYPYRVEEGRKDAIELPRLCKLTMLDDGLELSNDTLSVEFRKEPFSKAEQAIEYDTLKPAGLFYVSKIDSIDGIYAGYRLPKYKMKSITVTHKGKTYALPQSALAYAFNPRLQNGYANVFVGEKGTLYLLVRSNTDCHDWYQQGWMLVDFKYKEFRFSKTENSAN